MGRIRVHRHHLDLPLLIAVLEEFPVLFLPNIFVVIANNPVDGGEPSVRLGVPRGRERHVVLVVREDLLAGGHRPHRLDGGDAAEARVRRRDELGRRSVMS